MTVVAFRPNAMATCIFLYLDEQKSKNIIECVQTKKHNVVIGLAAKIQDKIPFISEIRTSRQRIKRITHCNQYKPSFYKFNRSFCHMHF